MPQSKLALIAGLLGALAIFDMAMGPALIHLGWVSPMFGFVWLFGLGLLEGLVGLFLGFRTTRAGSGVSGRGYAVAGVACGLVTLVVLGASAAPSGDLPSINDITTDLADPPTFASDPAERGRDMSYPAEFVEQVRAAYPDLAPKAVDAEPARTLELAEATAQKLGWEVVRVDTAAGTVLARERTSIFLFVDDVLIRVRPGSPNGAILDLRSKSRDGRGDLGANAARIRRFFDAFPG